MIKALILAVIFSTCVGCNMFLPIGIGTPKSEPDYITDTDTDTRPLTAVIKVYNEEGHFVE